MIQLLLTYLFTNTSNKNVARVLENYILYTARDIWGQALLILLAAVLGPALSQLKLTQGQSTFRPKSLFKHFWQAMADSTWQQLCQYLEATVSSCKSVTLHLLILRLNAHCKQLVQLYYCLERLTQWAEPLPPALVPAGHCIKPASYCHMPLDVSSW